MLIDVFVSKGLSSLLHVIVETQLWCHANDFIENTFDELGCRRCSADVGRLDLVILNCVENGIFDRRTMLIQSKHRAIASGAS